MTKTPNPDPMYPCADSFCFSACTSCKFPEAGEHRCPKCGRVHPVARGCWTAPPEETVTDLEARAKKAEAERDAYKDNWDVTTGMLHRARERAEAAEAMVADLKRVIIGMDRRRPHTTPASAVTECHACGAETDLLTVEAAVADGFVVDIKLCIKCHSRSNCALPAMLRTTAPVVYRALQAAAWTTEGAIEILRKRLARAEADVIECQETYAAARAAARGYRAALAQSQDHPQEYFEFGLLERLAKAVGL